MSLRVAFQMDPIHSIDIAGDSSFALALEAQERGHKLFHYEPKNLSLCLRNMIFTLKVHSRLAPREVVPPSQVEAVVNVHKGESFMVPKTTTDCPRRSVANFFRDSIEYCSN